MQSALAKRFRETVFNAKALIERFKEETKAVAAVEFAILVPLMLVAYVGTIEISAAMSADRKLSRVTNTIGDLLTRNSCYTTGDIEDIFEIANDIMFPVANAINLTVIGVEIDATGAGNIAWSHTNGGYVQPNGSAIWVPVNISSPDTFLVTVQVSMDYMPAVGWYSYKAKPGKIGTVSVDNSSMRLSDSLFMRPRIGSKIDLASSC